MMKLNSKLIDNPAVALEVMMAVTAAIYTGMTKETPTNEAMKIAELCASMWHVCDALKEIAGGDGNGL